MSATAATASGVVHEIEPEALWVQLESSHDLVLDVREPREFLGGHVPSARNVPLGAIAAQAAGLLSEGRRIVIACEHGKRALKAADVLLGAGLRSEILVLAGGTARWRKAGLPTEH
ncbi:Rhodanese-like domain-containing protein [Rhodovastum atsumiense]|nr:rhodanese-like domain-containing protein [Rhodovastum atsumiense]CAH2602433.1 Rhodanese-like domain-containing protein [Rhodovastum atsumiense]